MSREPVGSADFPTAPCDAALLLERVHTLSRDGPVHSKAHSGDGRNQHSQYTSVAAFQQGASRARLWGNSDMTDEQYRSIIYDHLVHYLAERYRSGEQSEIGRLCDDRLDKSGRLLGLVREVARR